MGCFHTDWKFDQTVAVVAEEGEEEAAAYVVVVP